MTPQTMMMCIPEQWCTALSPKLTPSSRQACTVSRNATSFFPL